MAIEFVKDPKQMTPDWLNKLLTHSGVLKNCQVKHAEWEAVGGGLMSKMVRVCLSYDRDEGAPVSMMVKYPTNDEGSYGLAQAMGMYELEVRFYQDIAPLLPDFRIPECYAALLDEQSGDFILVLEDCSKTSKPGDVLTPATHEECNAVLKELVHFQAPLWNSKSVTELGWLNMPQRTVGVFDAMANGLEPFLDRFGDGLSPEHINLFESVVPKAGEWARSWQEPTVVQHGDFRADNVMFGSTPSAPPATIIDFQTIRLGPPGVDAAYFLGSSLPTNTRRTVERELIQEYHAYLLSQSVQGYDWDTCWDSYREGALYAIFLFVGTASQVVSTERGDKVIVDQTRRYADMAIDLEAPKFAGL